MPSARYRLFARCLAGGLLALAAWSTPARGQDLPADTIRNVGTLNDAQQTSVKAYIAGNSAHLAGADAAKVRADLDKLRKPLADRQASVAFRRAYTNELRALLDSMLTPAILTDAKDLRPFPALALAGELATDRGIDWALLGLASDRAAVRHQAAQALGSTFVLVAQAAGPMVDDAKIVAAITALGDRVSKEPDGLVLNADVRALIAAMDIASFRNVAMERACKGATASARQQAPGPVDPVKGEALLRAGIAVREVLSAPNATVQPDAAKAGAELGGIMVAYTAQKVLRSPAPIPADDPVRVLLSDLASTGQTLVFLAGPKLQAAWTAPAEPLAPAVIAWVRKGTPEEVARFGLATERLFGKPDAILSRPPFDFRAEHFTLPR